MHVLLRYSTVAGLHQLCGEQLARGALYLERDLIQQQFAAVDVTVEGPDGTRFSLACQVLQAFPGQGTALTITAAGRDGVDALMAHAMAQPAQGDALPPELLVGDAAEAALAAPQEEDPGTDADGEALPVGGNPSVQEQVAAMSLSEKRLAALHGTKDQRLFIARDNNKALHVFLLKNPALTQDEAELFSRMTTLNPEALHLLAKDWAKFPTVVRNLVKNPKTPMPDAVALVDKLGATDLRAIAKSGSVRMPILQAARKKVTS